MLSLGLKLEYKNQAERKGEMTNQGLFNWLVHLVLVPSCDCKGTLKGVILSPGICQVCFVGGED